MGGGSSLTAFPNDDGNKIMISIGAGSVFGHDVHITAANGIFIGKGLRTGKSVLISDNAHGNCRDQKQLLMRPDDRPLYSKGAIFIGENVWIGEKAAILSGVHVGDGAVIGANSVVTHDVPAFSIVAGCPAKIKEDDYIFDFFDLCVVLIEVSNKDYSSYYNMVSFNDFIQSFKSCVGCICRVDVVVS